jgi:signal transduction histidine kinase/DNA-binding response OmpR family regulator
VVRTVADGEEALKALRAERPDLLLSDIMMPRSDGYQLLRALRGDPALADLPVILLSARAGEEASVEGLEAGADDYLVKPFSASELLARVRANLEMARVRQEAERRLAVDLDTMTRLNEVGKRCIGAGNDFDRCLAEILDAAIAITGADKGHIRLLDAKSGKLEIAAQSGFERPFLNFFAEIGKEDGAWCGAAMQSVERVIVEDVARSEMFVGQAVLGVLLDAGVRAIQSTPLVSSTGNVFGMISTHFSLPHRPSEHELRAMDLLARQAEDYLERKQAEATLRELKETLERKVEERTQALESEMAERQKIEAMLQQARRLEAIGQLTGGIAHDFNNLLTVVVGQTEAIMATANGNERIFRMAHAAQRAAERGAQLTNQLLAFSRRQQLRPVTVDVRAAVVEIGELVSRTVGAAITVDLRADPELRPSHLDPLQFETAILNLAINARDAMPNGGRLTIGARNATVADFQASRLDLTPGEYVIVGVTDTGPGMTPEVQRRAFEPFFTTKDVGKGTGLGLAQIYGFAKQSGGTATIDSTVGKGTTVALYLPRADTEIIQERPSAREALAMRRRGRTILVVEDRPDVLEVVEMFLDSLDYRILTAADGIAARKLMESGEAIDLLLTDMVMPNGVSGLDLAQDAQRLRPDLKIVMMSGYVRHPEGRAAASSDVIFLEKPFRQPELAGAIAAALGGGR